MRRAAVAWALALALVAGLTPGCGGDSSGPIRIGVMLPFTGPDAVGFRAPLTWAQHNVNAAGGVDGRPIEFVYRDLHREPVPAVAESFVSDPSIVAAIGPANSEDARRVISKFVAHGKVLVSPSATSADLFRAFAGHSPQYFWRPVQSDIGQVRTMLDLGVHGGATSVALVAGDSEYGTTFFDWFGFLATEMGLHVTATVRYDEEAQPCDAPMAEALAGNPDVLLAVPDHAEQAMCMADRYRASGSPTRLVFSDAAQDPSLIEALGARAQGLEGTGLAPDPSNGFARAFEARFHKALTPYAASTYDSVLLLAYALQRSGGEGGAQLARSVSSLVAGRGPSLGWDARSVATALSEVAAGRRPAIHGAVGPWRFDRTSGLELVASTYEHWRIEGDRFVREQYVSTAGTETARAGRAAGSQSPSLAQAQPVGGGSYEPGAKSGTWALLVAASDGWANYRHQADVLAQYQLLRANDVPDDRIILVSADDLAHDRRNPDPGTVRNSVGGPNLHRDVHVDYPLRGMTAERLMNILSGHASADTPKVIASGPADNVYVYIAGHGNQQGVYLGLGEPVPSPTGTYSVLSPAILQGTIAGMASEQRYRRIVVAVDACQGGVLGENLVAPGALVMSAANAVQDSLSANYDASSLAWLADQFSYELWKLESTAPALSIDALYQRAYLHVEGSSVTVSGAAFGDPSTVQVSEFVTP